MNKPPPPRPASVRALFWAFSWLALQGFGGVLAVVQRELVEKRQWLTPEEFVEDWAVAQIMPGANVVNLALIVGDRYFGWRGALAALAGMLALPLCVVLALTVAMSELAHQSAIQGALRGMAAVSAGLIAGTGLKLVAALRLNTMGIGACAALAVLSFIAVALMRMPLVWVLLCLGVPATLWAYHCLLKQAKNPEGGR
jgi:chromate transporter